MRLPAMLNGVVRRPLPLPIPVPTQTAVASCGVMPANQVWTWESVVPVLPADGRPGTPRPWAVPPGARGAFNREATPAATFLSRTRLHGFAPNESFLPLTSEIDTIGVGSQ